MDCRCGCKTAVTEGKEFIRGHQTVYRARVFRIADDLNHKLNQKAHGIIRERSWQDSYGRHLNALRLAAEKESAATEKRTTRKRTKVVKPPTGVSADEYAQARDLLDKYGIESGNLSASEVKELVATKTLDGVPVAEVGFA